jgi:hypothetical protein
MKNKRLTYVLLPLVLLIWGIIFYKIFTHGKDDNEGFVESNIRKTNKKDASVDSFVILANYRDPFLDRSYRPALRTADMQNNMNNRTGLNMKPQPVNIIFPDLQYYGLIANPKNKQKVGLIKMNNKDFILKEGESADDVKVLRLFNDSVMLTYMNNKKTIKKNNNKR